MKNKINLFLLLVFGCILYSCDSDDVEYQNEFQTSEKAWLTFKETSNNSYKYTSVGSTWVGYTWETTITVKNGIVIQRDYKRSSIQNSEVVEWTESTAEIGSHNEGGKPVTLDEIYHKAKTDWLVTRKNTQTSFKTNNNGMISTCGYTDNNCADDCFIGINISNIEAL